MADHDPYPTFTRNERIADAVMHVAGIAFALTGTILLIVFAAGVTDGWTIAGLTVYGAALIGSFVASGIYHFTPWENARPVLRRFDYAAIFLKIAGTYTPLVLFIGSAFSYAVLAVVWGLALIGVAKKLFFWAKPNRWTVALYLLMGWLSVALIVPMFATLPVIASCLIIAGGLIYSAGSWVFSRDALRFQNAIWHGFVLAASACFFAAITLAVFATS